MWRMEEDRTNIMAEVTFLVSEQQEKLTLRLCKNILGQTLLLKHSW